MSESYRPPPTPIPPLDPALPVLHDSVQADVPAAVQADLPADNRRARPRFVYEALVTIDSETCFTEGFAENLSEGGIYIATLSPPRVGEQVTVMVRIDRDACPPLRMSACVVWHRYNDVGDVIGCGMAWAENSRQVMFSLRSMMSRLDRVPLLWDF